MKDIIKQISQIDAVAYENEQKNQSVLLNEKQRFENEIKKYREQKLKNANKNAKIVYEQIVSKAKNEYQTHEDKLKNVSCQIEENYFKIEKQVINEIINKLFVL